jgi:hypothetical protein
VLYSDVPDISTGESATQDAEEENMNTTIRRTVAAIGLAGMATAGAVALAGTASATPADHLCSASEVDTSIVPGDGSAGQGHAYVQLTAKPGDGCSLRGTLEVNLRNAPDVTVDMPSDTGPLVTVADGQSATMLLNWADIQGHAQQQTPTAVTVTFPGDETSAPSSVTVPWTLGGMDTGSGGGLTTNDITAGAAPAPPA